MYCHNGKGSSSFKTAVKWKMVDHEGNHDVDIELEVIKS